jgi:zinc/manganese transport system permease protein
MSAADLGWIAAPALALLVAGLLLVPLGAEVLARGVVFIDLAVAQVAACGVLAAGMLVHDAQPWVGAVAAAGAALLGSAGVWWLARRWPQQREALIGLVYVAGAGATVIAVASDPHGRERLTALLAADVLWVPWGAVLWLGAAAAVVTGLSAMRGGLLRRDAVFYPAFALALSVAVQTLGLYLVFALLIGPALWTRCGASLTRAIGLAAVASLAGLGLSWALDWPSGACVALALCLLGVLSVARAPRGSLHLEADGH